MKSALKYFKETCENIEKDGLTKNEKVITSPQGAKVTLSDGREVINMCANNYLGLGNNPEVISAAKESYNNYGYGLSSVRFICGTQSVHKELEEKLSKFLKTDDSILYSSCFDANGGLFETLLTDQDAVISDELNHASIIDGIRLCKAKKFRYKNNDMQDLEEKLKTIPEDKGILIVTDGVFSMSGEICKLPEIIKLKHKYGVYIQDDEGKQLSVEEIANYRAYLLDNDFNYNLHADFLNYIYQLMCKLNQEYAMKTYQE